ncbi:MAG: transposase [Chloroflexi bacterium]|nr:transposase [Chloroflexota bacterium]
MSDRLRVRRGRWAATRSTPTSSSETCWRWWRKGRSIARIERDLDLTPGLVYKWQQQRYRVQEMSLQSSEARAEQAELRRLKRELEIVKQERDILKKAIQVFSRGES